MARTSTILPFVLSAFLLPSVVQGQVRVVNAESVIPAGSQQANQASSPTQENAYTILRVNNGPSQPPYTNEIRYQSLIEPQMLAAQIGLINYISIPTKTVHNGIATTIRQPQRIYTWHQISNEPEVQRQVTISDRFGKRQLLIRKAEWLVCPAEGRVGATSVNQPSGQFYKAFRVGSGLGNSPINEELALSDGLGEEQITLKRPRWVLVPVHVWRDNVERPIQNAQQAFVCYAYPNARDLDGSYQTRDLFGPLTPPARNSYAVMVSAKILDVAVTAN